MIMHPGASSSPRSAEEEGHKKMADGARELDKRGGREVEVAVAVEADVEVRVEKCVCTVQSSMCVKGKGEGKTGAYFSVKTTISARNRESRRK